MSQRGCRVTLDSVPGGDIQGFAAGTVFNFRLCADNNTDGQCDNVSSSNPAGNSDGKEHVITRQIGSSGKVFQMAWEDKPGLGDADFNDFIATIRLDADTDGDGLWDDWETTGIDTNGDGVIDLVLPGANPLHKDVYVEIDYMDCAVSGGDCATADTHSHRPKAPAIAAVVAAFANANVSNPDGLNGVALHVDISNAVKHQKDLTINGPCSHGGTGVGSFDAVKADPANFGPNNPRRFAYHYSLWAHEEGDGEGLSGCGEQGGNDFEVSLGAWNIAMGDLDRDGLPDENVGGHSAAGWHVHARARPQPQPWPWRRRLVDFKAELPERHELLVPGDGYPADRSRRGGPPTGRIDYSRAALPDLVETRPEREGRRRRGRRHGLLEVSGRPCHEKWTR